MEPSFKHYQIGAILGAGGYGQVYEAWDSKLCRHVAVKRLRHDTAMPGAQELAREARLAASVQHAAFVKIYAIEDDADSQSIVMELVRGETLGQLVRAGPLAAPAACAIIKEIAQAMQEAHQCGLLHGDLKPSNVMRDMAGRIRILDFGLASRRDATTSLAPGDPRGTIAYMAPELLGGSAGSVQTDVYALGVMLYELVTGARPFATLDGLALAAALVQSTAHQWDGLVALDAPVRQAILAMTARNPAQRLPDMAAAIAALDGNVPTGPAPVPRGTRRRRAWWLALPLAALVAGGALAWYGHDAAMPLLATHSTAEELARGLAALRLYDRPGQLADAGTHLERVLAQSPDNAAAVAGMSILYSRRHQSDGQDEVWVAKAMAAAQQALQLNDQLALAHAAYGIALERDGRSAQALDAFARALALDPDNVFALLGKVKALIALRRYDDARAAAAYGLTRHPAERSFADLTGQSYFEQGDYAAAETAFRRSLQLQPDAVFAYANLSAALHRQGRTGAALQVLQQGLQVRPNAWLYGNLGTMLFAQGDYPGAVAAFQHAVSPQKGNPGNYLGWANLADALLWIPGRAGEAQQAYARARALLAPRLAARAGRRGDGVADEPVSGPPGTRTGGARAGRACAATGARQHGRPFSRRHGIRIDGRPGSRHRRDPAGAQARLPGQGHCQRTRSGGPAPGSTLPAIKGGAPGTPFACTDHAHPGPPRFFGDHHVRYFRARKL